VTIQNAGLTPCYQNTTLPLGGANYTAAILQLQQAKCDSLITWQVDNSDIAIAQAVKNAGLSLKADIHGPTGYDDAVLNNTPAKSALQGDYFTTAIDWAQPNAPTQKVLATLKQLVVKLQGDLYIPINNNKPICGTWVPVGS
jgi:hypothetical protein